MLKKISLLLILFVMTFSLIHSQEKGDWGIKWSGYVNVTGIFDSRQVVALREGHFYLYPKPKVLDANGNDVNEVANYNLAVIQTRFTTNITGPNFIGAKTNAVVETEFMGNSEADVNGVRIRLAFINLTWGETSLLLGQTWNPNFIPSIFPDQIGSNGGAPFQPFARSPQIRLTHNLGSLSVMGALISQRDYTSTGPIGSSSTYLRNAVIPDFHLQLMLKAGTHLLGLGGEFKTIKPAIVTANNYKTDEKISSFAVNANVKLTFDKLRLKLAYIYGSNLTDYLMLGGYAVKSIDPITAKETYTALKAYSAWGEISYGTDLEFGIFAGITKSLGADDKTTGVFYARQGNTIENIVRIAPRIQYTEGKMKFSLEYDFTTAAFGTPDLDGIVQNSEKVSNSRIYFSTYYFF